MAQRQNHHRTSGIDVQSACRQGRIEQGEIALGEVPRCAHLAGEEPAVLRYRLAFYRREAAHPLSCTVTLQTTVQLDCARCLEPMSQAIDSQSEVAFVFGDTQAEHVDAAFEPVVLDETRRVDPLALLADDLLMALPLMPIHEHACLDARHLASGSIEQPADEAQPADNPFAALQALKKNNARHD